jgi:hypothetical protein
MIAVCAAWDVAVVAAVEVCDVAEPDEAELTEDVPPDEIAALCC